MDTEDGIRDVAVTGVQTCALPIYSNTGNNSDTLVVTNALMAGLPVINFETAATGLNALRQVTNSKSNVTENAAASLPLFGQPATSTKIGRASCRERGKN